MQHIFPLRVYYEDTDAGGVVYHANYLKFMERARSELMLQNGYTNSGCFFIVRHIEVEYFKPTRLYDELQVITVVKLLAGTRIVFDQKIVAKDQHDLILCQGFVTVVCIRKDLRPCRIPKEYVEKLERLIHEC